MSMEGIIRNKDNIELNATDTQIHKVEGNRNPAIHFSECDCKWVYFWQIQ